MFQSEILKLRALTIRPDTGHDLFSLLTFCGQRKGSSPHICKLFRNKIIMRDRHHARHQTQLVLFGECE